MEIKSLKEIASLIRTGKTPPTKEEKYFDGEINWYSPGDLDKTKYLFTAKRTITQQAIEDKKAITFPKDTLLVGCIGDIGKLGITSELSSSNQQLTGVLPNNETNVSYLYYWFKGNKKVLENYSNNAVVPILNNRTLETVKIPLPPLDQQKKIAAILDAADTYRQKTKGLIKKYDELTQSLFLDMFGDPVSNPMEWDKVALNELCDFKKTSVKPEEIETGDTYIGLECIEKQTGKILERFIVEAGEIKSNKFWFDSNYILYGKLRPYLNKVANPDFEGVCSTDIIPIRPILKNTVKEFIISLLRGSWFVSFADERCSGANLPRISPKEVEKYQTINPPIKLQNQFAERVQAIEAQKAQAQASLAQAEDLFNSLLQRAFKGELVS